MASCSSSHPTPPPNSAIERNFYEILNATKDAPFHKLKANYKQLILKYHPDKRQQRNECASNTDNHRTNDKTDKFKKNKAEGNEDSADINKYSQYANAAAADDEKEFLAITEAWNCLKDPVKRKQYDMEQLMLAFQLRSNIYARMNLSEMKALLALGKDLKVERIIWYSHLCPCGGEYSLSSADVDDWRAKHNIENKIVVRDSSDERRAQNATNKSDNTTTTSVQANDLIIECNQCSLAIAVDCTSSDIY